MVRCKNCGILSPEISETIGVCIKCLKKDPENNIKYSKNSHKLWRQKIGLPKVPPHNEGIRCIYCVNECVIPENGMGFCGIISNKGNKLTYLTSTFDKGMLYWYLDLHPTNCVATPVCPASTSRGYPKFTYTKGVEIGCFNLAVFFAGCNLDCLFCQNIEHKYMISLEKRSRDKINIVRLNDLYKVGMGNRITCICYFGGDPTPHSIYAIKLSRKFIKNLENQSLLKRICWETNGLENPKIFEEMIRLSLKSGGILKLDWKAYSPVLYNALTGINGEKALNRIKNNITIASKYLDERKEIPLLVISSLIVPHYVNYDEIYNVAKFLANIDHDIPLVLLGFAPHHLMKNVPSTSKKQMSNVYRAAIDAGLKNVFIGNIWLLRKDL